MPDGQVLAMLEHIKDIGERTEKKLDEHIVRDEATNKDFLLPLWNSYQQRKGAIAMSAVFYGTLSAMIAGFTTWWGHR